MRCPFCGLEMKKTKKDYKYTESGLDNIILKDLTVFICDCGEEMPSIFNIEGLHQVIALEIVGRKTLLTGPEIRFIRKEMGLNAVKFAEMLRVSNVTVSRWETGEKSIGQTNDKLIRLLFVKKLESKRNELIPLDVSVNYQLATAVNLINISMGKEIEHGITIPTFTYQQAKDFHYDFSQTAVACLDGLQYECANAYEYANAA